MSKVNGNCEIKSLKLTDDQQLTDSQPTDFFLDAQIPGNVYDELRSPILVHFLVSVQNICDT